MRNLCTWQGFIVGTLIVLCVLYGSGIYAAQDCSVTYYFGAKTHDSSDLSIAGIDLKEYGYVRIDQIILTNREELFIIAATSPQSSPELSVISLNTQKKVMITENLGWFDSEATFMVFYLNSLPQAFVLVEYVDGNVSRETEETITRMEIFRAIPEEERYISLYQEILTKTMIYIDWSPDAQYPYIDFSDTPKNGGPATKERMKYFLSDVNGDGYADILIWKGKFMARGRNEPGGGDFFLAEEELHVMYFEPDKLSFSSMTSIEPDPIRADHEILMR